MFGRERNQNSFYKLVADEKQKAPIPPDQTQTDKIVQCVTSWSISETNLMDMSTNNFVELALELTMPSSNMKVPWCLKIYPKGHSGYQCSNGDSEVEFTLKVDTSKCTLETFQKAVMKDTSMEVKLQFRTQDSDVSPMEESKASIQVVEFMNIGLRGRMITYTNMLKFIKNGVLVLDAVFLLSEVDENF